MTTNQRPIFALPDHLHAKSDPTLIGDDEAFLRRVAVSLRRQQDDLTTRVARARQRRGGSTTETLERDQEVHRLSGRLRMVQRYGVDLCLGRMVAQDGEVTYIGRLGLTDGDGARLLLDWRSPAAAPFFGATLADPMGLRSRRRYRWAEGRVRDYWDEVYDPEGDASAALDDQSAFLASLAGSRAARMRDVLGTIAADQDAIIRASAAGALVVDGGPGTGKTVVALHRAAYLRYRDPQLRQGRGGVLVVGPHRGYLAYTADVLPSLGEEGVRTATLADLVPEGAGALATDSDGVPALKGSAAMVDAVATGVRWYQEPPTTTTQVETAWADAVLRPGDWAEAFAAVEEGVPHNEARDVVLDALVEILADQHDDGVDAATLRSSLRRHQGLNRVLDRAWPVLEPGDVVGDLWSVPAFLGMCAPWLTREQVRSLQRPDPQRWTESDLPILDAAHRLLGDPEATRRRRSQDEAVRRRQRVMDDVVSDLIATDSSDLREMSMLRGADLRAALAIGGEVETIAAQYALAGPFAHVVVDEAQELTDAQWRMLLARCPSGSFTVVGDRAQARAGFAPSWQQRLEAVGFGSVEVATLRVNYRTPAEVMNDAEPVIRAAVPDANVPTSVRRSGVPVRRGAVSELEDVVQDWIDGHDGLVCVIGARSPVRDERVRSLTPVLAKGLEFDLVVLVEPDAFGDGVAGAVDRYVAMTRATAELVVLT